MTCHWETWGGVRNPSRYTSFLIMFIEGNKEMFSCFHKNHQQRHSTLKTDVHSAITVLSRANEDAIWGNYILIRVWVETKVACVLFPSTGWRIWLQLCSCSHGKGGHTRHSVALSPLADGGVRDHNIISRQEGTCWWNMREAEGHWTGVNINTNTASQNDWLPQRACCEKSIQHSNPLYPPAFTCWPTSLHAALPGVFKMYNH